MTIKAGGRSALIMATGLFLGFAGLSPAAAAKDDNAVTDSKSASTDTESAAGEAVAVRKYVRHRHWKRHAHHRSSKAALRSAPGKKTDTAAIATDGGGMSTAIPPAVANANAQLAAADTPEGALAGNARAMSTRANNMLQTAPAGQPAEAQPAAETETPVVPADQTSEADRSLPAGETPAPTMAIGMANPSEAASSEEGSGWDEASLIGKIFIGLGSLLTLASAARMLMV
jgi:hypothetical protein